MEDRNKKFSVTDTGKDAAENVSIPDEKFRELCGKIELLVNEYMGTDRSQFAFYLDNGKNISGKIRATKATNMNMAASMARNALEALPEVIRSVSAEFLAEVISDCLKDGGSDGR